ncbi:MAG: DUF4157 domain-containing protein [Rhodospirillales bacterium]|nr:MAG: DUF4157 domain-containing protein [Rhodospirillales bacterium]
MRTRATMAGHAPDALIPAVLPVPHGLLQRKCTACEDGESILQRRRGPGRDPDTVPAIVHDVLRGPGQPLDPGTRAFFEPRFGHDFSRVRVHTDARAAESARAVNARAYTVGSDIVFTQGAFAPGSRAGGQLLAHELAHVVQQGTPRIPSPGLLRLGRPDTLSEVDADRAASRVVAMPAAGLTATDGVAVPMKPPGTGLGNVAVQLQRVGECDNRTVRNCAGTRCTTAAGRRGVCQWGGITYGCRCRDQSGDAPTPNRVLELFPTWLLALLSAAAIAAIIACFATGVCEAAALGTAVGAGVAAIVIGILRANGVTVTEEGQTA